MSENNPSTRSLTLITGGVAVIALAAVFLVGMQVTNDDDPAPVAAPRSSTETFGIVTAGEGTVTAKPDQLTFTAAVRNQRASTAAAMAATNAGIRAVTAAARKGGVAAGDIETTSLSVRPEYDYSNGRQRLTGYVAAERITILVKKLADGGKVIGAVTTAGGNAVSVGSIKLTLSNRDSLVAQARTKAVKESKAAAVALAEAAGREVGTLEYVEEVTPQTYADQDYAYANDARLSSLSTKSVPISAGKQDVAVNVSVRWSLR
ncbi:MAG: hypothetical protein JWQ74_3357 [Marmoricola sp.]|nr:hypothetical protein [Marmoricola sp.]